MTCNKFSAPEKSSHCITASPHLGPAHRMGTKSRNLRSSPMFHLRIRDILGLTFVVAFGVTWHLQRSAELAKLREQVNFQRREAVHWRTTARVREIAQKEDAQFATA